MTGPDPAGGSRAGGGTGCPHNVGLRGRLGGRGLGRAGAGAACGLSRRRLGWRVGAGCDGAALV